MIEITINVSTAEDASQMLYDYAEDLRFRAHTSDEINGADCLRVMENAIAIANELQEKANQAARAAKGCAA